MDHVKYGFKAKTLINDGRITATEINLLKSWLLTENMHLNDEQIVLFSLSCLNQLEETKKVIKTYYNIRNTCPALFSDRNAHLHELQQQLKVVEFCIFPKRSDGCAIIFHRLKDTNFRAYDMEAAMKLLFMTLDVAIHDYPPTGLIVLFDMRGVGLLHLTRVKLNLVKVFFQYLQESLPVRLHNIHVLNSVYFLEKVINLIKPFIKSNVMELIHFHPSNLNMQQFYENYISKECLPLELGGYLESIQSLHQRNTDRLMEMQPFFEAEEKHQKENN